MKKSTLGIIAVIVIVGGGGGGCLIKQQLQTPAESTLQQAPASVPTPTPAEVDTTAAEVRAKDDSAAPPVVSGSPATTVGTDAPKDAKQSPPAATTAPAPTAPPAATTAEGATSAAMEFKGPDNASPADKKEFTADEAKGSIAFRWTALVPKPKETVTYRLRVWQLMQGQNGTQAMKENKSVVTKDVDNETQTAVSGIYTGPCKPPYLCDFVWGVEATTSAGLHMQMSNPSTFSVAAEAAADGAAGSTTGSADGTR